MSLGREAWHPRALRPAILLEGPLEWCEVFQTYRPGKIGEGGCYSLKDVSFENWRARAWISLRLSVVRRCTPNFSTAKLPSTEP
jgi:hypothetical protein